LLASFSNCTLLRLLVLNVLSVNLAVLIGHLILVAKHLVSGIATALQTLPAFIGLTYESNTILLFNNNVFYFIVFSIDILYFHSHFQVFCNMFCRE
jgi:hypothetical protein